VQNDKPATQTTISVPDLGAALMIAKYMGEDRARFVLSSLLQSGAVSIEDFRMALENRKSYLETLHAHGRDNSMSAQRTPNPTDAVEMVELRTTIATRPIR
jgi:hypothetical protein